MANWVQGSIIEVEARTFEIVVIVQQFHMMPLASRQYRQNLSVAKAIAFAPGTAITGQQAGRWRVYAILARRQAHFAAGIYGDWYSGRGVGGTTSSISVRSPGKPPGQHTGSWAFGGRRQDTW